MATITTKETRAFNWANPGTLKVGDEIVETLKDGREVVFVVVDDGVIGLKNLLGYHCMNEDWTNKGGWLTCDMRRYLNEEIIALLPDELVAAIKPRKFGKEEDKLWLFSEMEVFGDHDWTENDPDRGFQFEYFKDRRNRIKVDEDGDASLCVGAFSLWGQLRRLLRCEQRRRREQLQRRRHQRRLLRLLYLIINL